MKFEFGSVGGRREQMEAKAVGNSWSGSGNLKLGNGGAEGGCWSPVCVVKCKAVRRQAGNRQSLKQRTRTEAGRNERRNGSRVADRGRQGHGGTGRHREGHEAWLTKYRARRVTESRRAGGQIKHTMLCRITYFVSLFVILPYFSTFP